MREDPRRVDAIGMRYRLKRPGLSLAEAEERSPDAKAKPNRSTNEATVIGKSG